MTNRHQWIIVAGVLAALVGVLVVGAAMGSGTGVVRPGSPAPAFRVTNVRTGGVATLRDYGHDILLVNIWATWCKVCEDEMPSLQRLYDQLHPDGLRIMAISIDVDPPEKVLAWMKARNLTCDILQDRSGRIQSIYQTTGVPESFAIDRTGVIVKKQIGGWEWDQPASVAFFRRLLAAPTTDGP
jgi:cytochrome c biogenesis protein CcmG/thiol:disulfide interchange protein DsbE